MGIFDVFKGKRDMEIAGDNEVDELDKGKGNSWNTRRDYVTVSAVQEVV